MATNPFAEAYSTVDHVEDLVTARVESAAETAERLTDTAMSTLDDLRRARLDVNFGPSPAPPDIDPKINVDINLPEIGPRAFGEIKASIDKMPSLGDIPDIPNLNIPDFTPSVSSLNIPDAPPWQAPGAPPTEPAIPDVAIPDIPNITLPQAPTLQDVTVPTFQGLNLPTFDAKAPEFQGTALSGVLQWKEPVYHPEIIDEVVEQLRKMWAGGSGIPEAVEQAMWARAMEREDLGARRAIAEVAQEFSQRGFTMPSGVQAARADNLRQELELKKLGLNRDLTIQIAQWQVENIRFACEQGIAAENVFVNIFLNQAQRMFEAARFELESKLNIYNAQVAVFNAKMNAYQINASVYNTLVSAELTKIEVFKAEIQAELARGELNNQKVQIYGAMISALRTQTEIYRLRMEGAEVKSRVIANKIEMYKAQVQAYAEQIQAQKVVFDAYESRVKGEEAKASVIGAEARAYAALIQGKASIADIGVKRADVVIQKNRALIDAYKAQVEAEMAKVQSQLAVIQASAQAYSADAQRFSAVAQAEGMKAQVEVSAKEAELRTNVAFYQAQVQSYIGNMEQLIRRAALVLDALKSAGSIASTLAAGAMSAVHVGATLSGSGAVQASGSSSYSDSKSVQTTTSHNYNYEGTR